jgi:hypothetical protein
VVKKGDVGDLSLLNNEDLLITREFNKMVDEIVKLTDPRKFPSNQNNKNYLKAV